MEEAGEPLWPWTVKRRCHRRWRLAPNHARAWTAYVSVGTLADGRWWVDVVSRINRPLQLVASEREADAEAERWRNHIALEHSSYTGTADEWEQVECYPTQGWQPGERAP
ncbi:MAG TPA: hypothetical protein VF062_26900 [Candidatus Limnocylindrales bacterium]